MKVMEKFKSGLAKVAYAVGYIFGTLFVIAKRLFAL
jgi:hypothetical protein